MNFLFWNVARRDLHRPLADLVEGTQANVLVVAEYYGDEDLLLQDLESRGINYCALPTIGCERIKVFTDEDPSCFTYKLETDHYSIREFSKPEHERLLLAMVHLPSKLRNSDDDQLCNAAYFKQDVETIENEAGHCNTVVLGDFNMNPFEPGMVSALAMHSLPCLRTARSGGRVIEGRRHSFFYNPTWNLLGDIDGVPGTYFYRSSSYRSFFWNTLDQVVLRPAIAERFSKSSLKVITTAGTRSLVNKNGRPSVSDHLPIFFTLDLSIAS